MDNESVSGRHNSGAGATGHVGNNSTPVPNPYMADNFDNQSVGGHSQAMSQHTTVMDIVDDKAKESEEVQEMKRKQPSLSLGWTIADSRCYMITLQLLVIVACAASFFISVPQITIKVDEECNKDQTLLLLFAPYEYEVAGRSYGCSWPMVSLILRAITPAFGALNGLLTIVLLHCCMGAWVLRDMKAHNAKRKASEKLAFSDVYHYYPYFRVIRKIVGWLAYLHFISFGMDLTHYLIGKQYVSTILGAEDLGSTKFMLPLIPAIPIAALLRLTHDAMWQRMYRHKFDLELNVKSDKGYSTTVTERTVKQAVDITLAGIETDEDHVRAMTQLSMGQAAPRFQA
mmetsp:Transcript_52448/g.86815  ORF Transcript_52448/g.86815 Transcript_52448/m.86815 type:complete len:343 (+) Transcript_52448:103-1131(+)|eukprot:CAMPEP_0202688522 /NCGR_PEP_ID=MMETSP1385-20130828/4028_1 /ASSEMBLY_ACC=CAM_ASM_000861 /TAXON_ID=933848 /ORGANISM="Elphidium margaritaceum" /LENGTH=342 /DNA_ID=CAMNT_0049343515 /DNA_START=88 /DNA_END=1116 /DNA_ORIENTATION=-